MMNPNFRELTENALTKRGYDMSKPGMDVVLNRVLEGVSAGDDYLRVAAIVVCVIRMNLHDEATWNQVPVERLQPDTVDNLIWIARVAMPEVERQKQLSPYSEGSEAAGLFFPILAGYMQAVEE